MTTKSLILRGSMQELEKLRMFIDDSAESFGLDERSKYRLHLICDELVTNIISYGFVGLTPNLPEIDVRFTYEHHTIRICITDNGIAFNPLNRPEPDLESGVDERSIGGLGIHFARRLSESMTYERLGERNILQLTIRMRQPEEERFE